MKKNSKGFTLVELLAAVVILGILAVFSIPTIINMINSSRNKMYITDAKKLVAQVDYIIRANSTVIEKPDPGDCIAVGLGYLTTSDFDTAPNNGEYVNDYSFVIVKNGDSGLEFSVMLVEKRKSGGYRGVELTTNQELEAAGAVKHVKDFKKDELIGIESVTKGFVKKSLGDKYLPGDVSNIYNEPDYQDGSTQIAEDSTPRIVKATISPSDGKDFNSLEAVMTLRVDDDDTPRKNLKVYFSIGDGYRYDKYVEDYGTAITFTHKFNFSDIDGKKYSYNGEVIKVYVIVQDTEKNEARKILEYKLHTNDPPQINENGTYIKKRNTDKYNMPTAQLYLSVSDDIDETKDLLVCFTENKDATSCSEYQTYGKYFNGKDNTYYTFNGCSNTNCLDGTTRYLKVFVKDSSGEISTAEVNDPGKKGYTFYQNKPPTFNGDIIIKSEYETFTSTASLRTVVTINAQDDLTESNNIKVTIGEEGKTASTVNYKNGVQIPFTFSGTYDGGTRTLVVTLEDEHGAKTTKKANYTVYKNKVPTISSFTVEDYNNPCTNKEYCGSLTGGNVQVNVSIVASDDITSDKDLLVCLSENNSCTDYKSYGDTFKNKQYLYTFSSTDSTKPYSGDTKKLYLFVKDGNGESATKNVSHTLYKNVAPKIKSLTVTAQPTGNEGVYAPNNSLNALIRFQGGDDLTSENNLQYELYVNDTLISSGNYSQFKELNHKMSSVYDGSTKTIKLVLRDSYGLTTSKSTDYSVYKNKAPTITNSSVTSEGEACDNESMCPLDKGNSLNSIIGLHIKDDIDSSDKLMVCISQNPDDCELSNTENFKPYASTYENKNVKYVFVPTNASNPYDGSSKTIHVVVKDTSNEKSSSSKEYKLYNNQPPIIKNNSVKISAQKNDYNLNLEKATFEMNAEDDLDSVSKLTAKVCYKIGNQSTETCTSDYATFKTSNSLNFEVEKYSGQIYKVYAYVKDSYGATTKTEEVSYIMFSDDWPVIEASGTNIYEGREEQEGEEGEERLVIKYYPIKVHIKFKVKDLFDTYQVCVNTSSTKCTNYSEFFDGSTLEQHEFVYDLVTTTDEVFIFARDSYGNITTQQVPLEKHNICDDQVDGLDIEYQYVLLDSTGSEDDPDEPNTGDGGNSDSDDDGEIIEPPKNPQVVPNPDEGPNGEEPFESYLMMENEEITAELCSGKCYYWDVRRTHKKNDDGKYYNAFGNEIKLEKSSTYKTFATYVLTKSFNDKVETTFNCNLKNNYIATCDFYHCFYNPKKNSYRSTAIGLNVLTNPTPITMLVNGTTYSSTDYYNMYESSYKDKAEKITLTQTTQKVPASAISQFAYDKDAEDPYLRVMDPGMDFPDSE